MRLPFIGPHRQGISDLDLILREAYCYAPLFVHSSSGHHRVCLFLPSLSQYTVDVTTGSLMLQSHC